MTSSDFVGRVQRQLQDSPDRRPPCTLIVGSGFSFPLIPTTQQIVHEDLPWWVRCQRRLPSGPQPRHFTDDDKADFAEGAGEHAAEFWKGVAATDADEASGLQLDDKGLPTREALTEAYKLVLSPSCSLGLSTPDRVRRYFMDIVARVGNRLNPAHLYLASLVAEKRSLFGTVFTTNFDPLVQRALQLVNVPYFVSDRPDTMQYPDDDDTAHALHLVHAHGSIYRYLLLNTPDEIEGYANRNQSLLQEYFRKHAVVVIGYSGWDDAITRALSVVDQFAHNLYWCDRGGTPEKSGLSDVARDILQKHHNAFYVPTTDAGELMVDMHQKLTGHSLPRLFRDPVGAVRSELDRCDLSGVRVAKSRSDRPRAGDDDAATAAGAEDSLDLGDQVESIKERLDAANRLFAGEYAADEDAMLAARVRERFAVATDLYFSNMYEQVIPLLDSVIENADILDPEEQALAYHRRAFAYAERGQDGDFEKSIADYEAVLAMPEAPPQRKAKSAFNLITAVAEYENSRDRATVVFDDLVELSQSDASTPEIVIDRAEAANNLIYHLAKDENWRQRANEVYDDLVATSQSDASTPEIVLCRAKAAFNLINGLAKDENWRQRASAVHDDLVKLSQSDASTPEIVLWRASAAVNLIANLARDENWRLRADEVYDYLVDLSQSDASTPEIVGWRATAAVNLGYGYRGADDIDRARELLGEARDVFNDLGAVEDAARADALLGALDEADDGAADEEG